MVSDLRTVGAHELVDGISPSHLDCHLAAAWRLLGGIEVGDVGRGVGTGWAWQRGGGGDGCGRHLKPGRGRHVGGGGHRQGAHAVHPPAIAAGWAGDEGAPAPYTQSACCNAQVHAVDMIDMESKNMKIVGPCTMLLLFIQYDAPECWSRTALEQILQQQLATHHERNRQQATFTARHLPSQ